MSENATNKPSFVEGRYVPKGYTRRAYNEKLGVEIFVKDDDTCAIAYSGKRAAKPDWHLRFRSKERMAEYATEWLRRLEANAERKASRKAEAAKPHTLKVGDLLRSMWGYEQTNVDYYQVTALIGKTMVEIREIAQSSRETGYMQGVTTPVPDVFIGEPKRVRPSTNNAVKVRSFAYAFPCSAEETSHWTAYA